MKSQLGMSNQSTSRFGKKIIVSVIVILVLLAFVLFFLGRSYLQSSLHPLKSRSSRVTLVKVPMGASDRRIGSILQQHRVIKNGLTFSYYVKSHHVRNLKAGEYRLSPTMSLDRIARILRTGRSER